MAAKRNSLITGRNLKQEQTEWVADLLFTEKKGKGRNVNLSYEINSEQNTL